MVTIITVGCHCHTQDQQWQLWPPKDTNATTTVNCCRKKLELQRRRPSNRYAQCAGERVVGLKPVAVAVSTFFVKGKFTVPYSCCFGIQTSRSALEDRAEILCMHTQHVSKQCRNSFTTQMNVIISTVVSLST